ncbi:MAG: HAD family hydrolase [Candidatus Peregrinibacteria bacterium]|nr:HAD family hydrolase [Candidatus Peregrinibacteria bacterium]
MESNKIKTFVWDVDNTLWDWISYAARTYPAMSEIIAEEAGVERGLVEQCMQAYYTEAETMESSWLVQGLDKRGLFDGSDMDQGELIAKLQKSFHTNRERSLALYPGIEEVLEEATRRGIGHLILTDAPAFHAASRLRHLDVDQSHFRAMIAMEDSLVHKIPKEHHHRFEDGRYGLEIPVYRVGVEKPHTDLETALQMTREQIREQVCIIGDNGAKDMALAARYECVGLHAAWGRPQQENLNTLSRFAPTRVLRRSAETGFNAHSSDRIAEIYSPDSILQMMEWR